MIGSFAPGEAILAHISESRRDEVLDRHGLPEKTSNTVTDREMLEVELDEIREHGIAHGGEEQRRGFAAWRLPLSVPTTYSGVPSTSPVRRVGSRATGSKAGSGDRCERGQRHRSHLLDAVTFTVRHH